MFDKYKLLYLEDEPIIALDTEQHLASLKFGELVVANRLADAENAAARTRFDVAILDINVDRGQTSIALGQSLVADGARVIFASGDGADRAALMAIGFHFVDKPFTTDRLTQALVAALDQTP